MSKVSIRNLKWHTVLTLVLVILILVLFAALFAQNAFFQRQLAEEPEEEIPVTEEITINQTTIMDAISSAQELVTCKYYYTDCDVYSKSQTFFDSDIKVPFTTDETVFSYTGVISAGVDLTASNVSVDAEHMLISVSLPEPAVLSHTIDENKFRSFDTKNSVFTETSLDDYMGMTAALKEYQVSKLQQNTAFWSQVKCNTESILSSLVGALDPDHLYRIQFEWQ